MTLSLVGLLFAGTNRGLLGVRTAYAVFTVGFSPLLFAAVNDLVGRRNQGRTTGVLNRTFAVGDLGGQVAIGALLGLLVPSLIFVGITAVSLVGTLAVGLLNDGQCDRRPLGAETSRGWLGRLVPSSDERRTLRRSQLGSVDAALTLRHATVHGIGTLVPIYLFTTVGVTRVTMGLLLAVSPAVQILLLPVAGRLADSGYRVAIGTAGIVLSGLYQLSLALAAATAGGVPRLAVVAGGFVLVAVGFAAMDVGITAVICWAVSPDRVASFMGLRSMAMGVGGVVGSLSVGALAVATSVPVAFVAAGVPALVGAAVMRVKVTEPADTTRMLTTGVIEPVLGHTRLSWPRR